MQSNELPMEQDIEILLKQRPWKVPPSSAGVVPSYLEQEYARIAIASSFEKIDNPPVPLVAALLRAANTDDVEEVRERALESLFQFVTKGYVSHNDGCAILWAATYDASHRVRCTALESLWSIDEKLGKESAKRLVSDSDGIVAETARNILESD